MTARRPALRRATVAPQVPGGVAPALALLGAAVALAGAAGALPASVRAAAKPTATTRSSVAATTRPGSPAAGSVRVTFDNPGATPRPIRETVVALRRPASTFVAVVEKITYPGFVCGFTFKGDRPASPATIRITGTATGGRFDSGAMKVEWDATSKQETSSASGGDQASGWNFLSAANTDRSTGAGWVVSAGAVPRDKSDLPKGVTCTLQTAKPVTVASGPVGYWAGFATS